MAGVVDGYRNRHVGTAIKLHQRAWALSCGIDTVVWSFDPLVRRNARLNVQKLGTHVRDYMPNFYGNMDDAINAGDRRTVSSRGGFSMVGRRSAQPTHPSPMSTRRTSMRPGSLPSRTTS